jgi:hydroxymethylpyrimidine pyrophosphatase-like HAD family hydrolase
MRIVCDLDGTLCSIEQSYLMSQPKKDAIESINKYYNAGHVVIIHTGRHWNHLQFTIEQLKDWGVKYHSLVMGKPVGDVYIDDLSYKSVKEFEAGTIYDNR